MFPPESSAGLSGVEGGAVSFAAVSGPEGAGSWHGSQLRQAAFVPRPRGCVQGWAWGGGAHRAGLRGGEPAPSRTCPQSTVGRDPPGRTDPAGPRCEFVECTALKFQDKSQEAPIIMSLLKIVLGQAVRRS